MKRKYISQLIWGLLIIVSLCAISTKYPDLEQAHLSKVEQLDKKLDLIMINVRLIKIDVESIKAKIDHHVASIDSLGFTYWEKQKLYNAIDAIKHLADYTKVRVDLIDDRISLISCKDTLRYAYEDLPDFIKRNAIYNLRKLGKEPAYFMDVLKEYLNHLDEYNRANDKQEAYIRDEDDD